MPECLNVCLHRDGGLRGRRVGVGKRAASRAGRVRRAKVARGVYMGKLCFKFGEVGQMAFVSVRGGAFWGSIEPQNAPSEGLRACPGGCWARRGAPEGPQSPKTLWLPSGSARGGGAGWGGWGALSVYRYRYIYIYIRICFFIDFCLDLYEHMASMR